MAVFSTQDHDTIIAWVEERDGFAAQVVGVHDEAEIDPEMGALRIGFLGYAPQEILAPMTWDDWFETFDNHGLTFEYELIDADGNFSHNYRII